LSQTYRSPQPLVRSVNALFDHPRSFHKEHLEFFGSSSGMECDTWLQESKAGNGTFPRIEAWVVPDSEAAKFSNDDGRVWIIAESVASEIARLLGAKPSDGASGSVAHIHEWGAGESRPVVPADFAVLVSRNHEAVAVQKALKDFGVPAIRKTDEDILASEEARELLTLLVAVNAPLQAKTRRAALATRLLGKSDREIREIEEKEADETVAKFQLWKLEWARRGISSALALIDAGEGVSKRLASSRDGERRLTNFRHLTDLLSGFAAVSGSRPNRLLIWLEQEIARANESGLPPEERLLQLESDSFAVKVTTMHSAKGLEFPLVFCPFLWTSKEPKGYQVLNRNGVFSMVDTNLCSPEVLAEIKQTQLEERLRLAYVALTRAKVKLWLCAGAVPGPKGSPSALDWLLRSDRDCDFSVWSNGASSNRGAAHRASLEQLAENLGGLCVVRDGLPDPIEATYARPGVSITCEDESIQAPMTFWRVTSFSQLTREKNAKGESPAETATEEADSPPAVTPNAFGSIPGGALLGTAVHDFLEKWDFKAVPPLADLEGHFAAYPLKKSQGELPSAAGEMLGHLRGSVLPGMGCPIAEACSSPNTSEWQFHLPVAKNFGIDAIANVFRSHDEEYASALLKLGSDQLEGFLQGFIDKIAAHPGAFGVIDWKTNKLAAYDQTALATAARASHYWLQTHLYLVALRRYLKLIGSTAVIKGAWLVYLRGVRQGTTNGILHIDPEPKLLTDLENLFA
ncbi:MAG: 3'-5' exonuclease, partial [Verrucomicrobiota bacterium]